MKRPLSRGITADDSMDKHGLFEVHIVTRFLVGVCVLYVHGYSRALDVCVRVCVRLSTELLHDTRDELQRDKVSSVPLG